MVCKRNKSMDNDMGWNGLGEWIRSVGDNNGSIYTIGYTETWAIGSFGFALVKWDSTNGNKIWNKTWAERVGRVDLV